MIYSKEEFLKLNDNLNELSSILDEMKNSDEKSLRKEEEDFVIEIENNINTTKRFLKKMDIFKLL